MELLLAFVLSLPPAATVSGRVVDGVLKIPVAAASITLESATWRRTVTSAGDGAFRFADVPAGEYALHVERSGYAGRSIQVRVSDGAAIDVELGLDLRPVVIEALTVHANPPVVRDGTPGADAAAIVPGFAQTGMVRGASPVSELGLASLARDVRGQDPGDPSDLLYVRGSALDLKVVLLDGAPVYTPFHMGGLLDPLEPTTLSAARLHVGAAPARLDGGLSYILELRTRPATSDRISATGAVDLMSARATVETPLGESGGVLAAARGASGAVDEALFDRAFGYGYRDALVRADWQPDAASNLRVTAFGNREEVELGEGLHDAGWGSTAVSASYDRTGDSGVLEVGASLARASGSIPRRTGVLDDLQSRNLRVRGHVDATRRLGRHAVAFGGAVEREALRERAEGRTAEAGVTTYTGYGEVELYASDELRLRGGLRIDADDSGAVRPAPRVAVTWLLSELTSLSLTAGSYHQYVRDRGSEAAGLPIVLQPARATHFALALDQQIGETTRLELQGFVKRFTDLPAENGNDAFTSGLDVWAYRSGESLTAWLGYSLVWLWSQPSGSDAFSQRFSAHQVLSLGARGHITAGVFADATLTYGSGLALTGIDISDVSAASSVDGPGLANESASTLRQPASSVARLDARIARTFELGSGAALTPYLKLVNVLDRRDALFFYDDDGDPDTSGRPLAAMPMIPLLGVEWRF